MKPITSFALVAVAASLAACATRKPAASTAPPRTVPALPEARTYSAAQLAALQAAPGGEYPGYQRIMVEGQVRYCRKNLATGSPTESMAICLTEAGLWAEQRRALLEQARAQADELLRAGNIQLQNNDGTIQLQNQESWRQLVQSAAVNMPVH